MVENVLELAKKPTQENLFNSIKEELQMKLKELKYENKELKNKLKGKNDIVPLQRKQDKENED